MCETVFGEVQLAMNDMSQLNVLEALAWRRGEWTGRKLEYSQRVPRRLSGTLALHGEEEEWRSLPDDLALSQLLPPHLSKRSTFAVP